MSKWKRKETNQSEQLERRKMVGDSEVNELEKEANEESFVFVRREKECQKIFFFLTNRFSGVTIRNDFLIFLKIRNCRTYLKFLNISKNFNNFRNKDALMSDLTFLFSSPFEKKFRTFLATHVPLVFFEKKKLNRLLFQYGV